MVLIEVRDIGLKKNKINVLFIKLLFDNYMNATTKSIHNKIRNKLFLTKNDK